MAAAAVAAAGLISYEAKFGGSGGDCEQRELLATAATRDVPSSRRRAVATTRLWFTEIIDDERPLNDF